MRSGAGSGRAACLNRLLPAWTTWPKPSNCPRTGRRDEFIRIRAALEHNLRSIDLGLLRNALAVITSLSGAGKSPLAVEREQHGLGP